MDRKLSPQAGTALDVGVTKAPSSRVYLLILLVIPLLLLFLAVPFARTNWFLNHNSSSEIHAIGYAAQLEHSDCEIVVYGDSTGAFDIDPELLTQRTGMKTCNLSENRWVLIAAGLRPLDRYLERNPPPRYVVLVLSGRNLRGDIPWEAETSLLNGIEYLVRFEWNARTLAMLARHPVYTYEFAAWVGRSALGYPDSRLRAAFRRRSRTFWKRAGVEGALSRSIDNIKLVAKESTRLPQILQIRPGWRPFDRNMRSEERVY